VIALIAKLLYNSCNLAIERNMPDRTSDQIKDYLLAGFLSLAQIAERTGVTAAEIDEVMMNMEMPSEWD
jgi:hypothetical protein